MIKTIKVKKQLRLDELIKYVWDNDIKAEMEFRSNEERVLIEFDDDGRVLTDWIVSKEDTFTVEVEEEITKDTVFKSVVGVLNNNEIMLTNLHTTIEGIQDKYGSMKGIYAVIDKKLELIWDKECEEE